MNAPLQSFGFKESRYERPNLNWVCGRAAEGQPCLLGPDARGHCQAAAECAPVRKGDRWFCARPSVSGGPCSDGPLPDGACGRPIPRCLPVRSLRARRGVLCRWTVALTFGGLLFLLGGPVRWRVASPGHLTSHHSLADLTCDRCHGTPGSADIPASASPGTPGSAGIPAGANLSAAHAVQDGRLCLNCHQLGPASAPFQPHGLPANQRAELTRNAQTNAPAPRPVALALSSLLVGRPTEGHRDVACAACHQEHRGKNTSLTQLSNEQCQVCHARQFRSFAHGHPAFKQYPFFRPTSILFDHNKHGDAHFKDPAFTTNAPAYCTACHQTDPAGRTMLVTNFAAACAACHLRQVREAPGLAFLGVPNLAVLGQSIGDWPSNGTDELTPFTQLLLSADERAVGAMKALAQADLLDNLSELTPTRTNELKAAEQLAWSFKELMADLITNAPATLSNRLQLVIRRQLTPSEAAGLADHLPQDTLALAQAVWFPHLQQELSLHESRKPLTPAVAETNVATAGAHPTPDTPSLPSFSQNSFGWYRTSSQILYRPAGHPDQFLQSWLDLSASASAQGTNAPASLQRLSNALAKAESPGRCAKCHSTDIKPPSPPSPLAPGQGLEVKDYAINWQPFRPEPDQHTSTRFSHQAHLSLVGSNGCVTCHGFKKPVETKVASLGAPASPGAPASLPAPAFTSSFSPIQKDVCARCHTGQQAGDSCLKCHAYHFGKFKPTLAKPAQNLKMITAQLPPQRK